MALSITFDPEPDEAFDRLFEVESAVAGRIDQLLDVLAEDPGAQAVRRRGLRMPHSPVALWGFTVPGAEHDYLVLWEHAEGRAVVRYLGPDFL